ncbi:unnamed protein product [Linum tenue]|uniref:Uncharacterized protein n=1 Tax=Linum tenue TaxID=586396 RepID=A0AAV0JDP2_9ROSI|nr:unnamed protein product [Linum tenue]
MWLESWLANLIRIELLAISCCWLMSMQRMVDGKMLPP